jgi:predicted metalloprotease
MRWQTGRRSTNIEDRRGTRMRRGAVGGGLGAIVLLLIALFFGVDPGFILNPDPYGTVDAGADGEYVPATPEEEAAKDFTSAVVGFTEDTWSRIFRNAGAMYRPPTLVLYTGAVQSACGLGQAAMGPFYCPADEKIYLDMSFFAELRQRFEAPGDFAQAYVIAHEVGHHIQHLMGSAMQGRSNEESVRMELQADCFAGVWANQTQRAENAQFLEPGDVEEGLRAASMIGDDRIQMRTRGYVVPESFTHGSAQQRVDWLRAGLETGDVSVCDTFR